MLKARYIHLMAIASRLHTGTIFHHCVRMPYCTTAIPCLVSRPIRLHKNATSPSWFFEAGLARAWPMVINLHPQTLWHKSVPPTLILMTYILMSGASESATLV